MVDRWLCHPLKSASMIKDRQDAVEDLNGIRGVVDRLQLMFRKLPDLERVISRIHAGSCKVKEFVRVLQSLKKLLEIPATLESYMPEFESRALLSILKTGFNQGLLEKIAFFENAFDPAEAMEDDLIKPFPGKDASYDAMNAKVEEIDQRFEKHRKECETVLQHRGLTYRDIGKEIYQLEVPAKLKVPKDWIMMSKTQQIGRYYNEAIRALVKEMQEAKELRDEALRCVKQRMFEKFDEDYQDW